MAKLKGPIPIETNELSAEQKHSITVRVITAVVLALILVPALIFGSYFFAIAIFIVSGLAAYEVVHASKITTKKRIPIYIFTIILVESYVFWIFLKNNLDTLSRSENLFETFDSVLTNSFTNIQISVIALLFGAFFYFLMSFLFEEITISDVFYYIAMTAIIGICIQSIMYLRYSPFTAFKSIYTAEYLDGPTFRFAQSWLLLAYVVIGIFANDIFAFFTGILFGKHKVNPRISPKKTWEGFIGGMILSAILSIAFAFIFDACSLPISPVLTLSKWYWVVPISLVMPVIADIGDFVYSAIKRHFGIKDFSNLLPGHGGILDRIDSLSFGCCFVAVFLIMITNGWNFLV